VVFACADLTWSLRKGQDPPKRAFKASCLQIACFVKRGLVRLSDSPSPVGKRVLNGGNLHRVNKKKSLKEFQRLCIAETTCVPPNNVRSTISGCCTLGKNAVAHISKRKDTEQGNVRTHKRKIAEIYEIFTRTTIAITYPQHSAF